MDTFSKLELPIQTKLLIFLSALLSLHYFSLLSNPFLIIIGIIFIKTSYAASIITILLLAMILFLILVIQKSKKAYYFIYLLILLAINTFINLFAYFFLKQDTLQYIQVYFQALLPPQYITAIIPLYLLTECFIVFLIIAIIIFIQKNKQLLTNK